MVFGDEDTQGLQLLTPPCAAADGPAPSYRPLELTRRRNSHPARMPARTSRRAPLPRCALGGFRRRRLRSQAPHPHRPRAPIPGAAERMPSTHRTMVSHILHRLSIHSPAAATRPATPHTTFE